MLKLIGLLLAAHAQPHPGQRPAARLGDLLAALLAEAQAVAAVEVSPHPGDLVVERILDLVLHRAVLSPAHRHGSLPHKEKQTPRPETVGL